MTLETITVDIADNIATVTLNRPPANAQNAQMRSELIETFDGFNDNNAVKVVVLTGHGKIFSAGADEDEGGPVGGVGGLWVSGHFAFGFGEGLGGALAGL